MNLVNFVNSKSLILISFIAFILILISPLTVFAQENFQNGEVVMLEKTQVINKDYFAAGEKINVSGTVNGDAYVAGGNITIDGTINGDLLVAGGNINILGNVVGNVRSAGGNVTISGQVGRNLSVVGGSISVTQTARINGSMASAGGSVDIYGPIARDLHIAAGDLVLASSIGGDVNTGVENLQVARGSSVSGNLNYWSHNQLALSPEATISGQISKFTPQKGFDEGADEFGSALSGLATGLKLINILSALVIGLLLVRFLPKFTLDTAAVINERPWLSFGLGFLALILTPFIILALFLTIIGIPIAILLIFALLIYMYLAKFFVSLYLGEKVLNLLSQKNNSTYFQFIVGLSAYIILGVIPFLGGLITFLLILTGMGALLIQKRRAYISLRNKKLI